MDIRGMMQLALSCRTKDEAKILVDAATSAALEDEPTMTATDARTIVLSNIGYMSGYYDRATAARLLDLFETRHPFFGAIEEWPKTVEETFERGLAMGRAMKAKALAEALSS